MNLTINAKIAKEIVENDGREYLSEAAFKAVIEYYDKCDEDMEFDPDRILGYWSEYTPYELHEEWSDFIEDGSSDDQILEDLNKVCCALKLCNGNFLITW